MTAIDSGGPLHDTNSDGGYVLEGLVWRRVCSQPRHPAPGVDGARFYSCGPGCPVPDTPAIAVEQAATLAALVRAHTVLYQVGRTLPVVFHSPAPQLWKTTSEASQATAEEIRRWESCDFTNRRAVLRAACHRLEVDKHGVIHRICGTTRTRNRERGHDRAAADTATRGHRDLARRTAARSPSDSACRATAMPRLRTPDRRHRRRLDTPRSTPSAVRMALAPNHTCPFGHELAAALRMLGRTTARASLDDFKHPWRHARENGYDLVTGHGYYTNAYDFTAARTLLLAPAGPDGDGHVALCAHDPLTGDDHRQNMVQLPTDTVLIVDSVFAFRPEYNEFWDCRIWLDINPDLARRRGIERDSAQEGVDEATRIHRDRYHVAEAIYLNELDPRSIADVVIDNSDVTAPVRRGAVA